MYHEFLDLAEPFSLKPHRHRKIFDVQIGCVDLILAIGKFIDYVETAPDVASDLRVAILKELRSAKATFEKDN